MPSNHELEIIMRLKDEISRKLQGIEGGIQKLGNRAMEMGKSMRQTGREISQMGGTIALLGASITGPLLLAFKNAENYSRPVHEQMERMRNATMQFQVSIANALVPVMERFTNILGSLLNAWNRLGPAVQQQIVQGAFMVGTFLAIGGGAIKLYGVLEKLGGTILELGGKFFKCFTLANLPMIATIAGVIILLGLMLKFKPVADTIMSALQVLFLFFLNGLETIRLVLSRIIAFFLGGWEKIFDLLSRLPGKAGQVFDGMAKGVKAVREEVDKLGDGAMVHLEKNTKEIGDIFATGQGSWSEGFDNAKKSVIGLWDIMKNPPKTEIQSMVKQFDAIKEIVKGVAQSMESSLSNFFFNVVTGQVKSMVDVFADFGKSVLQILTQVLAKLLIIKAFTALAGSSGKIFGVGIGELFHAGGIVRAHSGLAVDEVPIIAQAGEGVLSRKGMSAIGRSNFDRLNSGESLNPWNSGKSTGGNVTIQPVLVINAWDSKDVYRHKAEIEAMMISSISNNGKLRQTIKRYS